MNQLQSNFTATKMIDIEDLNEKYDRHICKTLDEPCYEDIAKYLNLINELYTTDDICLGDLKRKHRFNGKNSFLFKLYQLAKLRGDITLTPEEEENLRKRLQIRKGKSHSGIISITVFTSGYPTYTDPSSGEVVTQEFSCHWNCAYCPNEPGQPRSYLKGEPGVLRANRNGFKCVDQMHDRMRALSSMGHTLDKLEVLVLGGTLASYPHPYVEEFVRDIYYAANIFGISEPRSSLPLNEEKRLNQTAPCKVIGLTLETRPDTITPDELRRFRYYGCTRVQLGIQHIDDDVLRKIRRQCTTKQTVDAIRLLKDCGYKIDAHWMPNLPGSSPALDDWMLSDQLLGVDNIMYKGDREHWHLRRPDLQVDQWKVYPCTLVPFTDIWEWYQQGTYIPYDKDQLQNILLKMKSMMFPWIRLNRIVRDIPSDYVPTLDYRSDMRNELGDILAKDGLRCRCIRCREVKTQSIDITTTKIITRKYEASKGTEYFISKEGPDSVLLGFVRLRITDHVATEVFPELEGCALVRELHVYGVLQSVNGGKGTRDAAVQHKGIGKELMMEAERIARYHNRSRLVVIAGEGTRGYYAKLGYKDHPGDGFFMMKYI